MSTATNTRPAADESAIKRSRMAWLVLLVVVVIGAAATGWQFYGSGARAASRSAEETLARQAEQDSESTIPVETIRVSKDRIKPGMYGIAKVILDTATKTSTLPAYCLVGDSKDGKGDVFVIKHRKAKKTKVAVGAADGIRIEVLSGITADDDGIVNTGSVSDGVPVRATARGRFVASSDASTSAAGTYRYIWCCVYRITARAHVGSSGIARCSCRDTPGRTTILFAIFA